MESSAIHVRDHASAWRRTRVGYALWAIVVICVGLLWRSGALSLSAFLFKYGGDALWAVVVFLACGFLFCRASTWHVGGLALGFAWAVEFSQLYHAGWIDAARATWAGRLVLGSTFNVPDLIAYAVGIGVGVVAELWARNRRWRTGREAERI